MEALLQEIRDARRQATAGEMEATKRHIEEALELLDDALARGPLACACYLLCSSLLFVSWAAFGQTYTISTFAGGTA